MNATRISDCPATLTLELSIVDLQIATTAEILLQVDMISLMYRVAIANNTHLHFPLHLLDTWKKSREELVARFSEEIPF